MVDVMIIGGGPAGVTAAIYCARAGLSVTLFERMFIGGQIASAHLLENYPGILSVSGPEFAMKLHEQAESFGVDILFDEVTEVRLADSVKTIMAGNKEYRSKAVILCMGASHRKLGLPDEERLTGLGVSYCATCDGNLFRGKDVLVIGGGDTACQDAIYLAALVKSVTLVHRRDELRAQKFLRDKVNRLDNIHIAWDSVVAELLGTDNLTGVTLRNVKTNELTKRSADGLFVSIGQLPDTAMIDGQITLQDGYIVCGEGMETSVPGVFAAGDVCAKRLRQVSTAVGDGALAATAAQEYLNRL